MSKEGTPAIDTEFEHEETGERVRVTEHMLADDSESPFVVERVRDGKEFGFEVPDEFHDQYAPVTGSN